LKVKFDIDRDYLKYLDSVCGIQGRSSYINQLLLSDREESEEEEEKVIRLHRRQKGYTFPTMIKPRGQSGSIRRGHSEYSVRSHESD
jgi:hypothetical protein